MKRKDGKNITVVVNATTTTDKDGKPTGSFAFVTDITQQKEAERMIEQSLREKETLLRELYHRTKNNMQVVSSLLSIKARGSRDEKIKAAYNEINNKVKSIALVHRKLYESHDLSNLNLKEYIIELTHLIWQSYSRLVKNVQLEQEMEDIKANIDMVSPLGLVIN